VGKLAGYTHPSPLAMFNAVQGAPVATSGATGWASPVGWPWASFTFGQSFFDDGVGGCPLTMAM